MLIDTFSQPGLGEERKLKEHHGVVSESSSEQQIVVPCMDYVFVVRKNWNHNPRGSYGRQTKWW